MSGNHFFKKTILTVSMGVALGLYGCGGGSSSNGGGTPEAVNTGVFIDAPVKGLQYSTATQSGVTNEQGEFKYKTGENVVFKIDGLEIGTVAGASEVPVTALPQYIDVARLLQSLDIDTLEELIDISGIKIPDSLKNQLKDLLENNQGDFDTVLTQEQLDAIESNSQVQLVNATPVTEQAAVQHITGSISENLTDNDFNRQSYIDIDGGMVLSFKDDGTGFEFNDGDGSNGSPNKSPFTWSVTNNKLDVNYTNGEAVNVSLLSVDGNKYVIAGMTQEGSFTTTLNKAKSLSISALDGKILAFDASSDPDCTARTIKITGTTGLVKEQCTGGYFEETVTLSDASSLDNAIYVRGSNPTDGSFSTKIHLVEGNIADGKYVFLDEPQKSAPDDVFFYRMYETDTEVAQ